MLFSSGFLVNLVKLMQVKMSQKREDIERSWSMVELCSHVLLHGIHGVLLSLGDSGYLVPDLYLGSEPWQTEWDNKKPRNRITNKRTGTEE